MSLLKKIKEKDSFQSIQQCVKECATVLEEVLLPHESQPQAFVDSLPPIPCASCHSKRFWVPIDEEKLICVKCSPPEFVSLRRFEVELCDGFDKPYFAKVEKRAPNPLAVPRASVRSNAASERQAVKSTLGTNRRFSLDSGLSIDSDAYCRYLERSTASWAKVQTRSLLTFGKRREPIKSGQCRKCRGTETKLVAIHNGQSERFDCAKCGAFVAFGKWAGSDG